MLNNSTKAFSKIKGRDNIVQSTNSGQHPPNNYYPQPAIQQQPQQLLPNPTSSTQQPSSSGNQS